MPVSGFPLRLVEQYRPRAGTWRARRGAGRVVARGSYRFSDRSLADARLIVDDDADDVRLAARLCERALHLVLRRFEEEPACRDLAARLSGEHPVHFLRGHDLLADLAADGALLLACDAAGELGLELDTAKDDLQAPQPEILRGLELLLALGQFHLLQRLGGRSQRGSLHLVIDLYEAFSRTEKTHLHQLLERPSLDSGNHFSLFLHKATRFAGEDQRERQRWRDQQVTWLLGQDRIDLPYDRRAVLEILRSEADPDEKRFLFYDALRAYDRELEAGNIARLAAEVRAERQQLVFGRMSRAFHNQGTLFADAVLVEPGPERAQLARQLIGSAAGSAALEPFAAELRLLLESPGEIPLTQVEGACERFEDAVLDVQKEEMQVLLGRAREQVENHADPLSAGELPSIAGAGIGARTEERLHLVEEIRRCLLRSPRRHAAYVVISQRPSPTGSHLLVKINEFEEPYLGKSENLKKLVRLAGDHVYSSPDYRWLEQADHWVEAIPLFIKEQVLVVDGRETTRTVIDIAGMEESFREQMADHWARNIRQVLDSEFLALGRALAADFQGDEGEQLQRAAGIGADEIAALGAFFAALYRSRCEEVHRRVETEEEEPYEAMGQVLFASAEVEALRDLRTRSGSWTEAVRLLAAQRRWSLESEGEDQRLRSLALQRRRPLPVLHVLTTQSAGMTEGYIRTWIEESMALYNVVEAEGLHQEVEQRRRFYAERIGALGGRVVRELGIWVEVEEAAAREQIGAEVAVMRVVASNRSVQRELALLGELIHCEEEERGRRPAGECSDPELVEQVLEQEADELAGEALERVAERNGEDLRREVEEYRRQHPELDEREALRRVVLEDEDYREDLRAYTRFCARRRALEKLDAERPELHLRERERSFLRRYGRLDRTTARKEVIAERRLNALTLHPLHYYQARGGNKRYHLLYTPSRVDLGHRERESVETWSQWVGGADRAAARAGRQIYSLINKSVYSYESLVQPELLKTGENASMASHFAFSNALSLMVSASRHGDIEEMGDQMSRRRDRLIHPAGEGYGGYCVPKDGLFLEFVLTLSRREKLRQIGLPDECHAAVTQLARQLVDRQGDFATQLEWEAWAAERLGGEEALAPYFSRREGTPVFQLTRIAHVLENLGQPDIRDPYRVTTSLAAHWGIHKMVAGGEHVNRFMPFFKTWLMRQAVREAAQRHPQIPVAGGAFTAVLTAEYKPDTQDGRFAVGMRKFEILAGTGAHLFYALDADGQELAALMHHGFAALEARDRGQRVLHLLGIDPRDAETVDQVRRLYPAWPPPAEMRVVSPTGLSTQDLLSYTSDTELESIAQEAQRALLAAGFSEAEIEANMQVHGPRPGAWSSRERIPPEERQQLREHLGGRLHALHLQVVGPERSYERALQGADVLDTGIPHRQLLDLLADPAYVCDLMLEGNPHSALVIVDGASGARRRALNRLDVMLWFAAGERHERQALYAGIGVGRETVEEWRAQMRRLRRRAERLGAAIAAAQADRARRLYAEIGEEIRQEQEVQMHLHEVEKLRRFGRGRVRDRLLGESLGRVGGNLPLEELAFADFLALGGLFLLDGRPEEEIRAYRQRFAEGLRRLGGAPPEEERALEELLHARFRPHLEEFREEKGIESSNKASEEQPVVALEARRLLAERIARARALNERQAAFRAVAPAPDFEPACRAAMEALGEGEQPPSENAFGTFLGHARNAILALVDQLSDDDHEEEAQLFVEHLSPLFSGREIDPDLWRAIAGGYEDIGDFGRLAQQVVEAAQRGDIDAREKERRLQRLARAGELFYILLAVETTIEFTRQQPGQLDAAALWRGLADFFAETINDHFYEYRPWLYARGIGFAEYSGESLYQLAVERHTWLYRYLRAIVVRSTEVRHLPEEEQDLLLGNFLDGRQVEAIGGGAPGPWERVWRSYGQLRELAFIRNDGFPLPEVFADFDPDLIEAADRVNHLIALPVGRTHYSRALREGPALCRQLRAQGRPGANLIIARRVDIAREQGLPRPVARVQSGHFFVDGDTYCAALMRHKGLARAQAEKRLAQIHPKGVRLAARFARPLLAALVYPFHGDPLYDSGRLEECGLPYTVQSLFHTWTTYDKAKYPDIFPPASGVDTPAEIDWLAAHTRRGKSEAEVKQWIENGLQGTSYPGLAAFARQHRIAMIKDAAESGGRNAGAFVLRRLDGSLDEERMEEAVDFVYQISLKHNVAIQEVILASPEYWASEAFMESFVGRQIVEWGSAVDRGRRPRTRIYGSHRIILSTDDPRRAQTSERWHISHWITLNSKQLITNVGRGGNLEQFLPQYIREEHRESILEKLAAAGRLCMEALAAYEARSAARYREETGRQVGKDLTGVSYGMPRYMMLDFLVAPIFAEKGEVVDIQPRYDGEGRRIGSTFLLRDGERTFPGTIADWRAVLIEPNIGVGLWDRVALREEFHERQAALAEGRDFDWERVGAEARTVLADLSRAGEHYLQSLLGDNASAS